jgi:hypothetical protein
VVNLLFLGQLDADPLLAIHEVVFRVLKNKARTGSTANLVCKLEILTHF